MAITFVSIREGVLCVKAIKKKEKRKITKKEKGFLAAFYLGFLLSLGVVFLFVSALMNENPPSFFPSDDSEATYTVEYHDGYYEIHYNSPSDKNSVFECGTDKKGCRKVVTHDISSLIGESPVDLKQYVNKKVVISGDFVYGSEQCIMSMCKKLMSRYVLYDITSIKEK